jgi:hypothetical protein
MGANGQFQLDGGEKESRYSPALFLLAPRKRIKFCRFDR